MAIPVLRSRGDDEHGTLGGIIAGQDLEGPTTGERRAPTDIIEVPPFHRVLVLV